MSKDSYVSIRRHATGKWSFLPQQPRRVWAKIRVPARDLVVFGIAAAFAGPLAAPAFAQSWAFEETFDTLDPASPSQADLPDSFDYSVTHRIHPGQMLDPFPSYRADHGNDCAGPAQPDPAMHDVTTQQFSSGASPDASFFVCKKHMMSSMGDVADYSVTSFWPRQPFGFAGGGVLEFDVNVNVNPGRFWWEIVIAPRDQLKVASAEDHWPIDETYPVDRIRLSWLSTGERRIGVGAQAHAPNGWLVNQTDWQTLSFLDPDDPALSDRTIRRKMRVQFDAQAIHWDMEMRDGSFHRFTVNIPESRGAAQRFTQGLVLFKTHAYTPHKDDNFDFTTWHWDNIRFSGPVLPAYTSFEADSHAYLQANGDRPIGDRVSQWITLPEFDRQAKLFGQIHSPMRGQVKLSINGSSAITINPHHYLDNDCSSEGWSSFLVNIPGRYFREGQNEFEWIVGPRPDCAPQFQWSGFSVKDLEVQLDPESK